MDTRQTRPSLLHRLRDREDVVAWAEFESKYGELIVRYARSQGLQHCDAEDLRQVVLSKLFRRLPGFEYTPERGRFRDYLGAAVRNALREWFSRPNRFVRSVDNEVLSQAAATEASESDAIWEREWTNHHFRLALASLTESVEGRSISIFRQLLAGRSVEEVAAAEGMTVEAVRKVRQRLRARLTELIEAQVRNEDAGDS